MSQTLHILRKDLRHLWPEITASLAVLLFYALVTPGSWREAFAAFRPNTYAGLILGVLLTVSWAVLVFRAVHNERLAGINQFWTTRPYRWSALLAAKLLFFAITLYLPFVLEQLYLLHRAELPIAGNLTPLLHNLIYLTAWIILPMTCVAVVTRSFSQAILVVLGGLLALTAFFLSLATYNRGAGPLTPSFLGSLEFGIELALLFAAVSFQYLRRATLKTIGLFAGIVVLMVLVQFILPGTSAATSGYATATDASLSLTVPTGASPILGLLPSSDSRTPRVSIHIPVTISDIPIGTRYDRDGLRYTLTAPDGYAWSTHWLARFDDVPPERALIRSSEPRELVLELPQDIYERFAGKSVSLHADGLYTEFRDGTPYTVGVTLEPTRVPDLGVCSTPDWFHAADFRSDALFSCRSPFGSPGLFIISTVKTTEPCPGLAPDTDDVTAAPPAGEPQITSVNATIGVNAAIGESRASVRMPLFSPVADLQAFSWPNQAQPLGDVKPAPHRPTHFCPNTPVTFTPRLVTRKFRLATDATVNFPRFRPH